MNSTDILRLLFTAEDRASGVVTKLRGELKGLQADMGPLGASLASALAPLAAGASVAGLAALFGRTVAGVDALNDLADATGDTVENLSALEDLAARTGTSVDVVGEAVVKLNKALIEAGRDPKSLEARAIKNLGLDVKELLALNPSERILAVSQALNSFGGENKLEYNLALLGKSVQTLAPFIKDLAEAGKLQAKVTTEQAAEAEKLRKEWASLQKDAVDLARAMSGPLVTSLNQTIDKLKEAKGFWETLRVIDQAASADVGLSLGLGALAPGVESLDKMNARMRELNSLLDTNRRLGLAIGQAPKLEAERTALQERIKSATAMQKALAQINDPSNYGNEGRRQRQLPALGGDTKTGKTPIERKFDESTGMSEALASALKLLEGTDTAKLASLNAQLDALFELRASGLGPDARVDEAIKKLRDELEQLDPAARRARSAKGAIDELLGIGPDSGLSKQLDQMQELQRRLDAGQISTDAYIEALAKLDTGWRKTTDGVVENSKEAGVQIALALSSAASAAINNWEGFGNFARGLLKDLGQLALTEMVFKPAQKAIGDGLAGFSWGSLFGGLPSFAVGTPYVPRDMVAKIHQGERIVPAAQNRSGTAGAAVIQQTNYFGSNVSRNDLAAWAEGTRRSTIAALADAQRRGYAV